MQGDGLARKFTVAGTLIIPPHSTLLALAAVVALFALLAVPALNANSAYGTAVSCWRGVISSSEPMLMPSQRSLPSNAELVEAPKSSWVVNSPLTRVNALGTLPSGKPPEDALYSLKVTFTLPLT